MIEKLKQAMSEKHISGYKLSQMTGISSSDIYQALKGTKPMFKGWKVRIADALEMSVDELFPTDEMDGEDDE